MKFKTIAEAFNHYMNSSIQDIEKRAAEIKQIVDTDPNADIASLNIELEGLKQAKTNVEQRSQRPGAQFNPITGASFERRVLTKLPRATFSLPRSTETLLQNPVRPTNEFETAAFNRAMTEQPADALALLPTGGSYPDYHP